LIKETLGREGYLVKAEHMTNRQIDTKTTKQVRIDAGLHQLLKIKATEAGQSIKAFIEGILADVLGVDK